MVNPQPANLLIDYNTPCKQQTAEEEAVLCSHHTVPVQGEGGVGGHIYTDQAGSTDFMVIWTQSATFILQESFSCTI